jgi:hypothetical protein
MLIASLVKHEKVCNKVFQSKTTKFDSSKQRNITGNEEGDMNEDNPNSKMSRK